MIWTNDSIFYLLFELYPGLILERKGIHAIFQKKVKKNYKKGKIFENLGKNVQNLKIF